MRGPGVRLDLDVRRIWQCPACQRVRGLSGDLTAVRCTCAGEPWMQLVGERRAALREQKSLQARELTVESFQLTEEELAKPLPGRIRRRGPMRGDAPGAEGTVGASGTPDRAAAAPTEQNPREGRGGGSAEQPGGNAPRRQRPPRPPRGSKKPLSEIAGSAETSTDAIAPPPSENPVMPVDDFSAGIDLPTTPDSAN